MVDESLLEILVCPEDKSKLSLANQEILETVNNEINLGRLFTLGGKALTESISEGLLREDGKRLYPIKNGIPVLLREEAICIP